MAPQPSTGSAGRQDGEPDSKRYPLTTGSVRPAQRPGGLPGSTSGGEGDPGRSGLARLVEDDSLIPPYTGV